VDIKPFNKLKKSLKKDVSGFPVVKLAIAGDSATQFLVPAIKATGADQSLAFEVFEAEYDQIDLQILNRESELYQHSPDFVVIQKSSQKLYSDFIAESLVAKEEFASSTIDQIELYYNTIKQESSAKVLFFNFIEIPDRVFYNYANKLKHSWSYQIRKLNFELMNLAQKHKDLFLIDLSSLNNVHGLRVSHNPVLYHQNTMDLNLDFLPHVANSVVDTVNSSLGKFKKCLILDLDHTCWGGIIGDDGIEGIKIGHTGIGNAFSQLQSWAKSLKERGIILAICSKNNEDTAKEPFEKHPNMVLRLEDISVFIANWENKADNIRYIQSVLNIGFDSMVFIDDNPFERNLVRSELPEVTVPELPEDPALYLQYLADFNLFETASYAISDTDRTKQYQTEAKRKSLQRSYSSIDEYLKNLEMTATVEAFSKFNVARISQLTQRSNQYNLRTQRYSEEDIESMMASKDHLTLSISLKDKYGDYGLISLIILKRKSEKELFIDTWIMSCRVLKRDVEKFVLNELVALAKEQSCDILVGERLPTKKNVLVENHYKDLGFKEQSNLWCLHIVDFKKNKNYIQKN